ncbi:MAG: efflux RND transporter periplasmic adaptor subunit [Deltaproteobacteria bacterium]|nr:efflux RND transporter periplasmic adaptor subunit [Deltaproteobacteria bacterium]
MRRTSSRGFLVFFVLIICTLGWLAGCDQAGESQGLAGTTEEAPLTLVKTARAYLGPIKSSLSFTGNVFAVRETKISSKLPGKIAKILVSEGVMVEKGDSLILLDQEDFRIAVRQARAGLETARATLNKVLAGTRVEQVEQAKAALEQARANLEFARRSFDRMQGLLKTSSVPESNYESAEMQLKIARAQLKAAQEQYNMAKAGATEEDMAVTRANVKMAEVGLLASQTQFKNTVIRAPFGGTIVMKMANEGETVAPGIPLLLLSDMNSVKVEFGIPEEYFKTIHVGYKGFVRVDAYPGYHFEGAITLKNPQIDLAARTFKVRMEIPNTDQEYFLVPGMFARIELTLKEKKQAVLVPGKAVLESEGEKYVMIVDQAGRPQKRIVETGLADKNTIEIISGLQAGEQVIIQGNYGLKAGSPIQTSN